MRFSSSFVALTAIAVLGAGGTAHAQSSSLPPLLQTTPPTSWRGYDAGGTFRVPLSADLLELHGDGWSATTFGMAASVREGLGDGWFLDGTLGLRFGGGSILLDGKHQSGGFVGTGLSASVGRPVLVTDGMIASLYGGTAFGLANLGTNGPTNDVTIVSSAFATPLGAYARFGRRLPITPSLFVSRVWSAKRSLKTTAGNSTRTIPAFWNEGLGVELGLGRAPGSIGVFYEHTPRIQGFPSSDAYTLRFTWGVRPRPSGNGSRPRSAKMRPSIPVETSLPSTFDHALTSLIAMRPQGFAAVRGQPDPGVQPGAAPEYETTMPLDPGVHAICDVSEEDRKYDCFWDFDEDASAAKRFEATLLARVRAVTPPSWSPTISKDEHGETIRYRAPGENQDALSVRFDRTSFIETAWSVELTLWATPSVAASTPAPTATATPSSALASPCGLNAYELGPKGLATAQVPIHGCDDIARLSPQDQALFWQTRAAIRALPDDTKTIPPILDQGVKFLTSGERIFVNSVKASATLEAGVDETARDNAAHAIPLPPGPGIGAPPDCHLTPYELGPRGLRTALMPITSCEDVGRLTPEDRALFYQVRETIDSMPKDATEPPPILLGPGKKFLTAVEINWVTAMQLGHERNKSH